MRDKIIITREQMDNLFAEARKAADFAYAPYSKFRVGAALLCENGDIITGVNVENRSFGMTTCAERNAVTTAIGKGYHDFKALAISTPDSVEPVGPCGACRQVLSEFLPPDAPLFFAGSGENRVNTTIKDILPWDSLHNLGK
jgi:cytidine deaminase